MKGQQGDPLELIFTAIGLMIFAPIILAVAGTLAETADSIDQDEKIQSLNNKIDSKNQKINSLQSRLDGAKSNISYLEERIEQLKENNTRSSNQIQNTQNSSQPATPQTVSGLPPIKVPLYLFIPLIVYIPVSITVGLMAERGIIDIEILDKLLDSEEGEKDTKS